MQQKQLNNVKPTSDKIKHLTEYYLNNGFGVVPVASGGKNPIIKNWTNTYFKSVEDYHSWLGNNKAYHNVGLVTGKVTGIIAIDIDKAKNDSEVDGEESLKALIEQLGDLPTTVEQRTRSGARQLFFKYPEGVDRIKGTVRLVDCIDIRADDNQVVVYPSYYTDKESKEITGSWTWINNPYDIPMADLPPAWIDFITQKQNSVQKPQNKPQEVGATQSVINEGSRNDSLFSALCSFAKNKELRKFDNLLYIALGMNQKLCNPPLEDAEVEAIVNNVINNFTLPDYMNKKGYIIYPALAEQILADNHILVDKTQKYIYNGVYYDLEEKDFYRQINSYIEDKALITTHAIRETNTHIKYLADSVDERTDPKYINFQNGLFNVETNTLEPHSHDTFSLGTYNAIYDPAISDISGTAWEQYLKSSLDESLIPLIQEMIGLCLFPLTSKTQTCFILLGEGSNGKSVLLNTIGRIIPQHLTSDLNIMDYETRFTNSSIKGKQVNIQRDDKTPYLDLVGNFKKVMSAEPIFIERKNVDGEIITTNITHISSFNKLPKVREKSHGVDRRLTIIPFNKKFGTEEEFNRGECDCIKDFNLENKLQQELDIIVAWAIEGLHRLIQNGYKLSENEITRQQKEDFKLSNDVVMQWIQDCVVKHTNLPNKKCLKASYLYRAFVDWANFEKYQPISRRNFDDRIKVLLSKQAHEYNNGIVYRVSFKGFNQND